MAKSKALLPEDPAIIARKLERARILEQKIKLKEGLPHLYGFPWYPWARSFFESTNRMNLLSAANQISKSSTQIRKAIDWATNAKKWGKLWKSRPLQFWYLYPSKDQASIEFDRKWVPEFLPRGEYKKHPEYGWKEEYSGKDIFAVHFNSGVSIYFKTYAQDVQHLQTSTCHAIFADEELPAEILEELLFRMAATDGYFHMVFTATLGQEFWREAMEVRGEGERFPEAFKQTVSMYDCLIYEDGSASPWTEPRIKRLEAMCKSPQEIARRIYGKFVKDSGLKYPSFTQERNVLLKGHPLPKDWLLYGGVDIGSGGSTGGHPAGIIFMGVNPEFTKGRIFKGWRGDGVDTTASDILAKFMELRGNMRLTAQYYDFSSKDFYNLAQRVGEPFIPAEKSHAIGEGILNTLFKSGALQIYGDDPELQKLVQEFLSLTEACPKTKARDDLIDPTRYIAAKVPWDWSTIAELENEVKVDEKKPKTERELRREGFQGVEAFNFTADDEMEAWNELYEI